MTSEEPRLPTQVLQTQTDTGFAIPPADRFAADLREFGPFGMLAILVIAAGTLVSPLIGAALVLGWALRSHTPWCEIGYSRPRSWIGSAAIGFAFGSGFKLLMKTFVMPLLGAESINPAYHYLVGNAAALPGMVFAMIFVAGFGEETVFRGYLFERLGKLLGTGAMANLAILLLSTGVFALRHFPDQGFAGVQQAVFTGLGFGTIFAVTGRIWMLICAHAAFDLTALAIIYLNLESDLAHLVFR
jgi:membrane protease YdiL (CAAX protease family)